VRDEGDVDGMIAICASLEQSNLPAASLFGWCAIQDNLPGQPISLHHHRSGECSRQRYDRDEIVSASMAETCVKLAMFCEGIIPIQF
jgi:hypothetical protein